MKLIATVASAVSNTLPMASTMAAAATTMTPAVTGISSSSWLCAHLPSSRVVRSSSSSSSSSSSTSLSSHAAGTSRSFYSSATIKKTTITGTTMTSTTTKTTMMMDAAIIDRNNINSNHRHRHRHRHRRRFYVTLSEPAPGSPFHYAFPVHDLDLAKKFYGDILGCKEGRSSTKWQDYSLHGHQIVCHYVGTDYRCQDYYNPVDGDDVPVPHAGLALKSVSEFHDLADRLREAHVDFIIEPHLRFEGQPGEQWTMFFKDPSGNNLEFKAMTKMENLFAKYNVIPDE